MATIDYQRLDGIHGRCFSATHGSPPLDFAQKHYAEDVGFLLEVLEGERARANDLQIILDMYGGAEGIEATHAKLKCFENDNRRLAASLVESSILLKHAYEVIGKYAVANESLAKAMEEKAKNGGINAKDNT